ncbi:MAG: DUF3427 domain-containing protein [Bryobacteraceae bacterium]
MPIKEGVYDQLVTRAVRGALDQLDPMQLKAQLVDLEEADSPGYLARHVARQIWEALRSVPVEDRLRRQVEIANALLAFTAPEAQDPISDDPVGIPAKLLKAIYSPPTAPLYPTTPLSLSSLLMNSLGEARLGFELEREMQCSDSVLMLVSFIQWRGWQRLKPAFEELARAGKRVRILTTTYIGASDFRALQAVARLPNVELKISLDGRRRRLHAKAWLFERLNGFSTAYVGSANLSGPALEDGIEWTVKLSQVEAPHVIERFRGAFDSMWEEVEFERFWPNDEGSCRRVRDALELARSGDGRKDSDALVFFDLKPHPYQQATLDLLEAERLDRGRYRNLVVAPTGTGKTLIAAFDYARQIGKDGLRPRLLFLAHREELLKQAVAVFRHVLREGSFGELLVGGALPQSYDHLFATIQSFQSRELLSQKSADFWDFAVLDEAHHTPAQSYRDLIGALNPKILLGLTATPERMDGESILEWFGGHIADEMRLWNAIECQYLVPFDYYGVFDGTDLSELTWSRGKYSISELNDLYSRDMHRANLVIKEFSDIYGDWHNARALGFCVSVEHAEFMAAAFTRAGIPASAVTSRSPSELRSKASDMLRTREVNVLFTVDLFNEGVDIPEADCILFLRPTESATVFIQQLGRGLRLNSGKTSCLVLDFIGNQRREFRFDLKYRALFGGTRQQTIREIETGVTRLPGNCYFRLDKESRTRILRNLRNQLSASRRRMLEELRAFGRKPSLEQFLRETQYDLDDIYKSSIAGWAGLLYDAGLLASPLTDLDRRLSKQFQHLLHVDSLQRLNTYEASLTRDEGIKQDPTILYERTFLMLTFRLLQSEARASGNDWATALRQLRGAPAAQEEFLELIEVLRNRVRSHSQEEPYRPEWPLYLHRSYVREEILIAVGSKNLETRQENREGRLWLSKENTEILFVTLDKSDKQFSPTTRYEDFAVSPTRFHWQSQSTTSEESGTGRRYIEQTKNGADFLLFVRPRKDSAFVFLGPLQYVSHAGSRPISIYWDLKNPMPAWFFEICASLRAA